MHEEAGAQHDEHEEEEEAHDKKPAQSLAQWGKSHPQHKRGGGGGGGGASSVVERMSAPRGDCRQNFVLT
jgi:hypothetical protein